MVAPASWQFEASTSSVALSANLLEGEEEEGPTLGDG